MSQVIGIDFDNTLICYDEVLYSLALREGWIHPDIAGQKTLIRDAIRNSPGGDSRWQQLQALAYGMAIEQARLFEGVPSFFHACNQRKVSVFIVSHKTETVSLNQQPVQLRQKALQWMHQMGFFTEDGFNLELKHVFFESSRSEKIGRIRALGCTHFIDDLAEVFAEPDFPSNVVKILFSPGATNACGAGLLAFDSWAQITKWFFRSNGT